MAETNAQAQTCVPRTARKEQICMSLAATALSELGHRGLARRRIAVHWREIVVVGRIGSPDPSPQNASIRPNQIPRRRARSLRFSGRGGSRRARRASECGASACSCIWPRTIRSKNRALGAFLQGLQEGLGCRPQRADRAPLGGRRCQAHRKYAEELVASLCSGRCSVSVRRDLS